MTKKLPEKFPVATDGSGGIQLAEKAYGIDIPALRENAEPLRSPQAGTSATTPDTPELKRRRSSLVSQAPPVCQSTQTPSRGDTPEQKDALQALQALSPEDQVAFIQQYAQMLDKETLTNVANAMFLELAKSDGVETNPHDFAKLATTAMARLKEAGKPDIMYKFAKCLGGNRPDTAEPLMPFDKMPFGLIEYQVEFFSCTNTSGVCQPLNIIFLIITITHLLLVLDINHSVKKLKWTVCTWWVPPKLISK